MTSKVRHREQGSAMPDCLVIIKTNIESKYSSVPAPTLHEFTTLFALFTNSTY